MRIAVDAMGGDHAPQAVVQGALQAARLWSDLHIILVGDSSKIEAYMENQPSNVSIHHTSETIGADDEPVKAVRRKKDSSMVVAGELVKTKQADAMISAGNTGALMATGLLIIGRIPGIIRPALAPMIPTIHGNGVIALDLGANMDATAEHLGQYAIMGSIYRSKVDGISNPRVGLLNIGTEASKGNELTKAAYVLLEQSPVHFIGNVESRDVLNPPCDVIVCDGFAGNIMLKSYEGAASIIFGAIRKEFTKNIFTKLSAFVMKPGLSRFRKKFDYTEHGAAPLLGIDGIVLKCHGSSDQHAFKNAFRQARLMFNTHLIETISKEISQEK
jgi:glycerol-3-phosphate acyltransferase PlsX